MPLQTRMEGVNGDSYCRKTEELDCSTENGPVLMEMSSELIVYVKVVIPYAMLSKL